MASVGKITIVGVEVEVHAETSGRWEVCAIENGGRGAKLGEGSTLEKASAQARTTLARMKVKVDVPFFDDDGRRGVAYGKHAGHGNVLARIDGKAVTITAAYGRLGHVLRGDTPAEVVARMQAIQASMRADGRELRLLREKYALDLSRAVVEAITAKQTLAAGQEG